MRIGIIGPTQVGRFLDINKFAEHNYSHFIHQLAEFLAKTDDELLVVPEPTAAPVNLGLIYRDLGGKKVVGLMPDHDEELGYNWLDTKLVDETISCGTWRNQPEAFCENSDVLLMIGLSPGTMAELCYAKWFKVKKIIIFKKWISALIHPEVTSGLNVVYIESIEELEKELMELR